MEEKKQEKPSAPVYPGPSKEVWDEALNRSGIDPGGITEYNAHNKTLGNEALQKAE